MLARSNSCSSLYIESVAAAPDKNAIAGSISLIFESLILRENVSHDEVFNPGGSTGACNPDSSQIAHYMMFISVSKDAPGKATPRS